jgi:hypothetical protein
MLGFEQTKGSGNDDGFPWWKLREAEKLKPQGVKEQIRVHLVEDLRVRFLASPQLMIGGLACRKITSC